MSMWLTIVLIVHVLVAIGIIGLVLLQHGKGADVGAAFGSGASGSLFGATGSANFLSRATALLAVIFFITSLGLTYLATHTPRAAPGVMDASKDVPSSAPVVPTTTPADNAAAKVESGSIPAAAGKSGDSKANDVPK
jgi:preprotein translocase subunit SecG